MTFIWENKIPKSYSNFNSLHDLIEGTRAIFEEHTNYKFQDRVRGNGFNVETLLVFGVILLLVIYYMVKRSSNLPESKLFPPASILCP